MEAREAETNGRRELEQPELEEEEEEGEQPRGHDGGGGGGGGFTLDDVLQLGGTKTDYVMLSGVDETAELIDGDKKGTIDDLKEGELEAFINNLGIRKYSSLLGEKDEEHTQTEKVKKKKEKKPKKTENEGHKETSQVGKGKKELPNNEQKKKLIQSKEVPKTSGLPGKKGKQQDIFEFHPKPYLLIKPGGKWYDMDYAQEYSSEPQNETVVKQYRDLAKQLYQHETDLYKNKKGNKNSANSTWMKTVVTTGTLADRMAAMTLLIQDTPVHTMHFVETLVSLVKKRGSRQQCLIGLSTLKELLISDLLPDNRKLQTFSQHPFENIEKLASGNRDARDKRLLLWYFEHLLKHQVAEFVQSLETMAHDTVAETKARALAAAHELLCNKPEQERALLIQIVNKMGDPQYKMATRASYLLETLLFKHPNMKTVVCYEVERLLYRPNISPKAQYYAICFLSQIVLSHEENDLAGKLITIYFSFFRACVKKQEANSKMLSAVLSGVNRAFPYSNMSDEKIMEQLDTLFKVVHVVNFSTSVQALMLLFQVMDSQQAISDRYYVVLYRKLLDPGLAQCSKQAMFLNLLYKSLKSDVVLRRIKAFVKRILQVTCGQPPPFICGALYLVSEILKQKPGLKVLLEEHEASDDEECFKDVEEEEQFKDLDEEKMHKISTDNGTDEKFADIDKEKELGSQNAAVIAGKTKSKVSGSWLHHQNQEGGKCLETYDPLHRNPLFCAADRSSLWELKQLSEHFHPSVALFATTILQGDQIQYSGDPLQDFTLMRFLDRFVYRNPKQYKGKENTHNVVMQPKQKFQMSNVRNLPVNSQEFIDRDESQIPVNEVFFHRYYRKIESLRKLRRPRGQNVEDVDDDEFEKALDSYEGDRYFQTLIDNDLDFASNMNTKTSKDRKGIEELSDLDEDDLGDLDDEEVSLSSLDEEDFGDEVGKEGGAFFQDSNEDVDSEAETSKSSKKSGKRKRDEIDFAKSFGGKKLKRGSKDSGDMFAAAEEFGYLLDENAGSKFDNIGLNAMANKDKAHMKQLQWESDRDAWVRGKDSQTLRKQKKRFKGKKLQNKRKGFKKQK
ncbi:CCAAT/enhancer-binding protein zeta [Callorhinchus milii]|uniref:CCAAT/enhancer-binding protein zeta n=1 Tax=Callorhinchus milii TaxID=7868 RepID=UPI001C3FBA08|nr:CCAAT/enhancer-binding protein zeta [Callorhinchus milii]